MADTNFSSIQAISVKQEKSTNPWVQTMRVLTSVQESSRKITKAEEKRQRELREAWKTEMDNKADIYPDMSAAKTFWQRAGFGASMLALGLPFLGKHLATYSQLIDFGKYYFHNFSADQLDSYARQAADIVNRMAGQIIQDGSQANQYLHDEHMTGADKFSQASRMSVDEQQSRLQQSREEDRSLKERTLEVIRTLTSQVMGR